ncbi:MAG: DUF1592 domain-containing protein [Polyangiaceae bacterium]|nr:DUF1592 domain-containing protein [Polyangiaceae bacterium]
MSTSCPEVERRSISEGSSRLLLGVVPGLALLALACSANVPRSSGVSPAIGPDGMPVAAGTGGDGSVPGTGMPGVGGGTGAGTGGGDAPLIPGPNGTPCAPGAPLAPARVWLLSDEQVVKVSSDVFGVTLTGGDAQITTANGVSGNYTNFSEAFQVDVTAAQGYQRAAQKIAQQVKPCGSAVAAACVEQFIHDKIARAWRRPLAAAETAGLMKIYNDFSATEGGDEALSMVIQAALQSGSFLYRTEIGVDASAATAPVALTANEVASAISFLLLDSAPDDALWAAANSGTLLQPAVLTAEVDRLLAVQRVRDNVSELVRYWAGVERIRSSAKDLGLFPEYTPSLKESLYAGASAFLRDTVWSGKFSDLFSSRKVYANNELASVYGLPAVAGSELVAVDIAASQPAAGLLTQPGVLAASNQHKDSGDPIHRGLFVYNSFVCGGTVPAPPAGALDVSKTMTGTARELAAKRAALPTCAGCHSLFDPLGLAFEQFDPIGRFKPQDANGMAIDSSATLAGLGADLDGPITGVVDLAQRLANRPATANCATQTLAKYSLGFTSAVESCDLADARSKFATSGSFADFFRALLTAPGFMVRDPALK